MAIVTKKATTSNTKSRHRGRILARKNGHRGTKKEPTAGVYMLRPRRLSPSAKRRATRLATLVRQDLAALEQQTTLDETMRQLRGRA